MNMMNFLGDLHLPNSLANILFVCFQEKRHRAILSLEITDYEKKLGDANGRILELERELEARNQLIDEKDKLAASNETKLTEAENTIQDLRSKLEHAQVIFFILIFRIRRTFKIYPKNFRMTLAKNRRRFHSFREN